jgi:hypothetical protein
MSAGRNADAPELVGPGTDDESRADAEAAWAEEIKRRVDEIRNGTAETYALEDVLAEMEECYSTSDDDLDEDPAAVEAAWAEEIKRRVEELDAGGETIPGEEVFARVRELARRIKEERPS